jgi:hypothetical protein
MRVVCFECEALLCDRLQARIFYETKIFRLDSPKTKIQIGIATLSLSLSLSLLFHHIIFARRDGEVFCLNFTTRDSVRERETSYTHTYIYIFLIKYAKSMQKVYIFCVCIVTLKT